jgi:hypothetical protein
VSSDVTKTAVFLQAQIELHAPSIKDLLPQCQWETPEHPPYSPDKSPYDFDFFLMTKKPF